MSLIGLDVGTTGCKAIAFAADGRILAHAYREYPLHFPRPGWIELDSAEVLTKVDQVLREVAGKTAADPPRGLAVSAQGEAVTPVDGGGEPLHPAIVTFDGRTSGYREWWLQHLSAERILQITGMPLHGMFSINKILWLKSNRPEIFSRAAKFLCFEDLVLRHLGLPPRISPSLAARTMAYDVERGTWSAEILKIAGVAPETLAEVQAAGSAVGEIPAAAAQRLGLPHGVIAAVGGHDQACGALGAGIVKPGVAMYATGTVECITSALATRPADPSMAANNLCAYPHAYPGLFLSIVFNFTGGSLLRWFRDTFAAAEHEQAKRLGREIYEELLRSMPEGPTSLLVLPHFTMSGTPAFDSHSRGTILGLQLSTHRGEVVKALLEGITYEMRLNLELVEKLGTPVRELRAIGGGARNAAWNQIKADILGRKVVCPAVTEAACLGAAMLAGTASGVYPTLEAAVAKTVKMGEAFFPRPEAVGLYNDRFALYEKLYPAVKEIAHSLAALHGAAGSEGGKGETRRIRKE